MDKEQDGRRPVSRGEFKGNYLRGTGTGKAPTGYSSLLDYGLLDYTVYSIPRC